jgi:hypothetical protein
MDLKNFCPITILSCSGKLFTAVLSERLTEFSDAFLILNENQCAFRRGYSIIDNLFIIHSLFEKQCVVPLLHLRRSSILCYQIIVLVVMVRDKEKTYYLFFLFYILMVLNPSEKVIM